ncbi:uncharacterized protein EI90DRAFT_802381 [Cantharellus anzutake]|uniref:uncharacterized protein n=1 Tax=Cantharellus anzutake TaxID=1750568 RepID=UPI0019088EB1|nr:uncharacterized protein EI90DRAFT_802381 [Cantharellus anzutake]KAF8342898.1 hypothetical protein EI90DRAFT_802381 [Cantharellus anzutake]
MFSFLLVLSSFPFVQSGGSGLITIVVLVVESCLTLVHFHVSVLIDLVIAAASVFVGAASRTEYLGHVVPFVLCRIPSLSSQTVSHSCICMAARIGELRVGDLHPLKKALRKWRRN